MAEAVISTRLIVGAPAPVSLNPVATPLILLSTTSGEPVETVIPVIDAPPPLLVTFNPESIGLPSLIDIIVSDPVESALSIAQSRRLAQVKPLAVALTTG